MEKLLEEDNFYSAMKLEKYGLGLKLKISNFVSFLAWTGMIGGALAILGSLEQLINPTDFLHLQELFSAPYCSCYWIYYVLGVVGMGSSAVWLLLHLTLRKRNVNNDFQGIKKILKIKCYITGSVEIIADILGLIFAILMAISGYYPREYSYINIIQGGFIFLCLVFACFKIHGVRKDDNRFINSYLVFKLSVLAVLVALGIFLVFLSGRPSVLVPTMVVLILISFVYIYYLGPMVVLYNFNLHTDSQTKYKNLAFTNQNFLDGEKNSPA